MTEEKETPLVFNRAFLMSSLDTLLYRAWNC